MLIEAESIPYEATPLRGERLLVFAPHPDDEVIGCGGLVAQHLREHRTVRIVVATDGAQGGDATIRESESRRGLDRLGEVAELVFLHFGDRALGDDAATGLREQIAAFRPDLILVPSPIEIHPDHYHLARVFCELVQRDESLFSELAATRVAFYEVGNPIRPNTLVDISDVADDKYAAIGEHVSQTGTRDYVSYVRGLNAFRAMTLPPGTKAAEAYYVVELRSLRTTASSELRRMIGAPREIETTRATLPISVIVRTKDRPRLVREAVDSIRSGGYPCEIVVVNDGGARPEIDGAIAVDHEQSKGRSEAANAGVRAATNEFIAFLDDDDLFYREHLDVLARAAATEPGRAAWYTDAVSAFLRPGGGGYETHARLRLFEQDFDRELLLVDNYIPLPTLLMRRADFLSLGGFDTAFDLFEDWDFLIRLSGRGDFQRVPVVTCEVRHFEGGSSVVLAAPEGSPRFREAKMRVWKKHASLLTNDVFANAYERQKKRMQSLYSGAVEARGESSALRGHAAEAGRKELELRNSLNGYMLRVRELEGALQALQPVVYEHRDQAVQIERLSRHIDALSRQNESLEAANAATHGELERMRVETERLRGLLDMIYHSKTWKLHTFVEKVRGRG